tara:strand:- start:413 stop:586 length:174 start_codon:yes stop_codon:yes gene_type:complete
MNSNSIEPTKVYEPREGLTLTLQEIIDWVWDLPMPQTLTDELKEDIIEKIEQLKPEP